MAGNYPSVKEIEDNIKHLLFNSKGSIPTQEMPTNPHQDKSGPPGPKSGSPQKQSEDPRRDRTVEDRGGGGGGGGGGKQGSKYQNRGKNKPGKQAKQQYYSLGGGAMSGPPAKGTGAVDQKPYAPEPGSYPSEDQKGSSADRDIGKGKQQGPGLPTQMVPGDLDQGKAKKKKRARKKDRDKKSSEREVNNQGVKGAEGIGHGEEQGPKVPLLETPKKNEPTQRDHSGSRQQQIKPLMSMEFPTTKQNSSQPSAPPQKTNISGKPRDAVSVPQNQVHSELEKDYLFPLRKQSVKFPNAKFFCRLCEYHCDDMGHCYRHMKDKRHKRLKQIKTTDVMLRSLPSPSPPHIEAVNSITDDVFRQHALSEEDIAKRHEAFDLIVKTKKKKVPTATLR